MPEFEFLLKQINDKIEKANSKIQVYAIKIIPLEEERDRLEIAKKGLEGTIDIKKDVYEGSKSSLRDIILEIIRNNNAYLNRNEITELIQNNHRDYHPNYIYVTLSTLIKDGILEKDKYKKFRMRAVGPKVEGEVTTDPNENTFGSFPGL